MFLEVIKRLLKITFYATTKINRVADAHDQTIYIYKFYIVQDIRV